MRCLARKPRTYWGRALTAFGFASLAVFILIDDNWRLSASLGRKMFVVLGSTAFIAALIGGALGAADSISAEKRNGTLGLLFLTDLKGRDIVLGKLAANGLDGLHAFLATLPVMALPLLLGGVTGTQVWQLGLVILNSLFFALAAALFVSAVSRGALAAFVGAVLLVGFFTLGILAIEGFYHELTRQGYREPVLVRIGPLVGLVSCMAGRPMPNQTVMFWQSVVSTHLLAWLFLVLASSIAPRVWQEKGLTVTRLKWRERLTRWSVGRARERKDYRQRMLDWNPVCWLDDRHRLQKSLLWAVFLAALTLGMWLWTLYPLDLLDDDVVIPTALITQGICLIWLAFAATQRLAEDKRSGALELLLATPISVREILKGRLLALRRQFGRVFLYVNVATALMWAGMMWYMWYPQPVFWPPSREEYILHVSAVGFGGIAMFILYTRSVALLGQWFALISPNAMVATVITLACVVGVHWMLFMGLMFISAKLTNGVVILFKPWHPILLWSGLGAVNCGFWMLWAWRRLNARFRAVASRGLQQESVWNRLVKRLGFGRA